jgi:hypothetical protein
MQSIEDIPHPNITIAAIVSSPRWLREPQPTRLVDTANGFVTLPLWCAAVRRETNKQKYQKKMYNRLNAIRLFFMHYQEKTLNKNFLKMVIV